MLAPQLPELLRKLTRQLHDFTTNTKACARGRILGCIRCFGKKQTLHTFRVDECGEVINLEENPKHMGPGK